MLHDILKPRFNQFKVDSPQDASPEVSRTCVTPYVHSQAGSMRQELFWEFFRPTLLADESVSKELESGWQRSCVCKTVVCACDPNTALQMPTANSAMDCRNPLSCLQLVSECYTQKGFIGWPKFWSFVVDMCSLVDLFDDMDSDKDGFISQHELQMLMSESDFVDTDAGCQGAPARCKEYRAENVRRQCCVWLMD